MSEAPNVNTPPATPPAAPPATPPAEPPATPPVTPPAIPPAEPPATPPAIPPATPPATPPVVPEKYEFTAPEGVTLDAEVTGVLSDAMKELAVPQDKAQAFVNKMAPVIAARQVKTLEATLADARTQWQTDAKVDKLIGGDKFDENMGQAKAVFNAYGDDELGKLLIDSGLGDHPAVIRWAYRVSKDISPDKIHTGRKTEGEKSPEQVMYGTVG